MHLWYQRWAYATSPVSRLSAASRSRTFARVRSSASIARPSALSVAFRCSPRRTAPFSCIRRRRRHARASSGRADDALSASPCPSSSACRGVDDTSGVPLAAWWLCLRIISGACRPWYCSEGGGSDATERSPPGVVDSPIPPGAASSDTGVGCVVKLSDNRSRRDGRRESDASRSVPTLASESRSNRDGLRAAPATLSCMPASLFSCAGAASFSSADTSLLDSEGWWGCCIPGREGR